MTDRPPTDSTDPTDPGDAGPDRDVDPTVETVLDPPTESMDALGPSPEGDGAAVGDPGPARRRLSLEVPLPRLPARARRLRAEASRSVRGIRGRVVLSYVLLVAGALALSLLVVRQVLIVRTDAQIEADLVQEVEELRILATGVDPTTGEPFGSDTAAIFDTFLARNVPSEGEVLLTLVGGEPYLETLGAPVDLAQDAGLVRRWSELTEPLRLDVGSGAEEARTLAVPLLDAEGDPSGVFVVAVFPQQALAEVDQAVRVIGGVGLVVLLAAALVALALARQVLRPVSRLTQTARRISDNDLSARFDSEGDDELAQLGDAFDDMLDRLQSGFDAQRDVLDDVAHELRTPITIVGGHLELLDEDPDERAATVELCLDELDRMSRYVDELLLVASARRPDFLDPAPLDVGEFAEGLFARVSALADRDWVLGPVPRPGSVVIEADAHRVTQAVVNLASNAVQHTVEGDRIEVAVAVDDERVHLSVRDHGPGVDDDVRDSLFTRFSRAAGSRSRRPEGTGLGLAIVAAVAEAHGGRVTLEDPAGGGARFTIALPRPGAEEDGEIP